LDLAVNLMETDSRGKDREKIRHRRTKRQQTEKPTAQQKGVSSGWVQDQVISTINDALSAAMQASLPEMVPDIAVMATRSINQCLADFRKGNMAMMLALPKALPAAPPELVQGIEDGVNKISLSHRMVSPVREVKAKDASSPQFPVAAAAVCSVSAVGCLLGVHTGLTGALACFSGCSAGISALLAKAKRQFVPFLNSANAKAWTAAMKPPEDFFQRRTKAAGRTRDPGSGQPETPLAAILDLPRDTVLQLSDIIKDYFLLEMPLARLLGKRIFKATERWLMRCLASEIDGPADIPYVVNAEVPAQMIDVGPEKIWVPKLNFAVVLECHLDPDRPCVSAVAISMSDALLDQVVDVVQTEFVAMDLRKADPRLAAFTEPVYLNLQVSISWPQSSLLRLDVSNLKTHLGLPQ